MRLNRMFVTVLALSLVILWGGVEQIQATTTNPIQPSTWGAIKALYGQPIEKGGPQGSYPNYCFQLGVPWAPQVPPGDWANTKNCGQTCAMMLGGYYNHGQVNSSVITSENSWLYSYTRNSNYLNPNGWYTGGSAMGAFQQLLRQYHAVQSTVYYGGSSTHADVLVNEAAAGNPPIVGVMISGGRLVSSGGASHWVLVIGYDGNIIVNDPGSSSGNAIRYSTSAFEASWNTQQKIYLAVRR